MFINFWYSACLSDELTQSPMKQRMLGQDFVLFRDSQGIARCLSDVCVHRGASLGEGKVKGDCVECPYHGWQFNGEGQCTKIPSLGPEANIPARAKVDSYPVQEKYGLVHVFLGDLAEAERPPIMEIEEWGQEGWAHTHQVFVWDIDYKRSIENGLDNAHNEFVHPTHGFGGERDDYQLPPLNVTVDPWGTHIRGKREAPPLKEEKMREASKRHEDAVIEGATGHHGVSCVWTHIHPTETMFIHQYLFETPIDIDRTRLYLLNMRNFLIDPEDDARMMERNAIVANQDRDVLSNLRPVVTPNSNLHEVFVEHDRCVARYREWLKEWQGKGWRIDVEAVKAQDKNTAFAIPSPARRNSKGWVLDSVPMIPAETAVQAAAE